MTAGSTPSFERNERSRQVRLSNASPTMTQDPDKGLRRIGVPVVHDRLFGDRSNSPIQRLKSRLCGRSGRPHLNAAETWNTDLLARSGGVIRRVDHALSPDVGIRQVDPYDPGLSKPHLVIQSPSSLLGSDEPARSDNRLCPQPARSSVEPGRQERLCRKHGCRKHGRPGRDTGCYVHTTDATGADIPTRVPPQKRTSACADKSNCSPPDHDRVAVRLFDPVDELVGFSAREGDVILERFPKRRQVVIEFLCDRLSQAALNS